MLLYSFEYQIHSSRSILEKLRGHRLESLTSVGDSLLRKCEFSSAVERNPSKVDANGLNPLIRFDKYVTNKTINGKCSKHKYFSKCDTP